MVVRQVHDQEGLKGLHLLSKLPFWGASFNGGRGGEQEGAVITQPWGLPPITAVGLYQRVLVRFETSFCCSTICSVCYLKDSVVLLRGDLAVTT